MKACNAGFLSIVRSIRFGFSHSRPAAVPANRDWLNLPSGIAGYIDGSDAETACNPLKTRSEMKSGARVERIAVQEATATALRHDRTADKRRESDRKCQSSKQRESLQPPRAGSLRWAQLTKTAGKI
nr:hypothetical protein X990_3036 [Burkholderia pseudomallei MSHR4868]